MGISGVAGMRLPTFSFFFFLFSTLFFFLPLFLCLKKNETRLYQSCLFAEARVSNLYFQKRLRFFFKSREKGRKRNLIVRKAS